MAIQKVAANTATMSLYSRCIDNRGTYRGGSETESNPRPDAASVVNEARHPLSLSNGVMISNVW